MKLYYYQRRDRQPNFGDQLNQWLWPQLCPQLFPAISLGDLAASPNAIESQDTVFVGTGTLLNHRLDERTRPARKLIIFSTGAGYEQPLRQIPAHWHVCCVRGPFSARRLGLSANLAITDGGILVARLVSPSPTRSGTSFMPHIHSAIAASDHWQTLCDRAEMRYIDPRWPVPDVLKAIGSSQQLITEAMHGAIVADALRVPWIPVTTSPRIYAFKWQDWCASMGLPYWPHRLPPLTDYPRWGRGARSGLLAGRHWLRATLESPTTTAHYALTAHDSAIIQRLQTIAQCPPYLSTDSLFRNRIDRLQSGLHQLTGVASLTSVSVIPAFDLPDSTQAAPAVAF